MKPPKTEMNDQKKNDERTERKKTQWRTATKRSFLGKRNPLTGLLYKQRALSESKGDQTAEKPSAEKIFVPQ